MSQKTLREMFDEMQIVFPQENSIYNLDLTKPTQKGDRGQCLIHLTGNQPYYLSLWNSQVAELFATLEKTDLEQNYLTVKTISKDSPNGKRLFVVKVKT